MRITHICKFYSPHLGGVEKHVESISIEAVKDGHEIDILTLKHDGYLPVWAKGSGKIRVHHKEHRFPVQIFSFFFLRNPFFSRDFSGKILERYEIWGWMLWNFPTFLFADIIHIHDVFFWYWPIRLLLPWKRVFITFHGFEAGSLPTENAKRARQKAAKWTRGNIAVGAWIEKWYGTKPDFITYGAADCFLTHIESARSNLTRCVFIGRVSPDTGAKVYEKVICELKGFSLDIYGDGSKLGSIHDSCIVFPYYDIACVSSYLSIMEAMQSKVLVLAYAADKLKFDYLTAHPMSKNMVIVKSKEEMRTFLKEYKKEKYRKQVSEAYDWAEKQTWHSVYLIYKKLWKK